MAEKKETITISEEDKKIIIMFWKRGFRNFTINSTFPGCRAHPKFSFRISEGMIFLEIDKNQHKNFTKAKEILRMQKIASFAKEKSIIFIRFNPDSSKSNFYKIEEVLEYYLGAYKICGKDEFIVRYLFYDGVEDSGEIIIKKVLF